MDDILVLLNSRLNNMLIQFKDTQQKKEQIQKETEIFIQALNNPENFDDDDYETLESMLDENGKKILLEIKKYLKVLNKFPNQPQVKEALKKYEILKEQLKQKNILENSSIYDMVAELNEEILQTKSMIDAFSEYDGSKYFNLQYLYLLSELLYNSAITDNILDVYKKILLSNVNNLDNALTFKSNKNMNSTLSNFIKKLLRLNESFNLSTINLDLLVYELFNSLLSKDFSLDDKKLNQILFYLSSDIKDKEILLRLKFLIHLYKVDIPYDDSQIDFLNQFKNVYEERTSDNTIVEIVKSNNEIIEALKSGNIFSNIELLDRVFKINEIQKSEMLKIICSIVYNNEKINNSLKKKIKK